MNKITITIHFTDDYTFGARKLVIDGGSLRVGELGLHVRKPKRKGTVQVHSFPLSQITRFTVHDYRGDHVR